MKTKIVIEYDDSNDAATVRVVQEAKFGDAASEITNAEKNQAKSLAKKLHNSYKTKSNPQAGKVK